MIRSRRFYLYAVSATTAAWYVSTQSKDLKFEGLFAGSKDSSKPQSMREKMENLVRTKQTEIVTALEAIDDKKFIIDKWSREQGGEGISCILQGGSVFEKAGVNVSLVHSPFPQQAIQRMRADHNSIENVMNEKDLKFWATGLSIVLHPINPMAPTVHLNYRYFEVQDKNETPLAWWFGGGSDLTPSYLYDEDAIHFHKTLKDACDKHDKDYYPKFKKWCDEYFRIKHRDESRGVGGIFFDDLEDKDPDEIFAFVSDCADAFLPAYLPILNRRKDMPYNDEQKDFQQIRRGRYVEFNLVNDRGTSFGMATPGARVESILMSLPLTARWEYMHQIRTNSKEEKLMQVLKQPKEWVS